MWVVKLGGSFSGEKVLLRWLKMLSRQAPEKTVVVPGGGRFADQVRQAQKHWRFGDRTAHHMALLAMQQMGRMYSALEPGLKPAPSVADVLELVGQGITPVWLPDPEELDRDGVPASWQVTSDSLSAWLAGKLGARALSLVKSVEPPCQDPGGLRRAGIVDPEFPAWLPEGIRFRCYHCSQFGVLQEQMHLSAREITPCQET